MKTKIKFLLFSSFIAIQVNSQVLSMPEVIQENDQWCWAGVTKSVLGYYGYPAEQCEIAEYAREVITWTSYGTTDCCVNPNQGCNYWNYNWGSAGSIQDILVHFGSVQNSGSSAALTSTQITTQIAAGRPFIVRWGWTSGGGHFVVGHGKVGSTIYYMNPWFGEGLHISTYSWLVNDGNHTWTHTNIISTNLGIDDFDVNPELVISPNPAVDFLTIGNEIKSKEVSIYSMLGQLVQSENLTVDNKINVSNLQKGVYLIHLKTEDDKILSSKFIKQ
jgi:hypothetical protein